MELMGGHIYEISGHIYGKYGHLYGISGHVNGISGHIYGKGGHIYGYNTQRKIPLVGVELAFSAKEYPSMPTALSVHRRSKNCISYFTINSCSLTTR